MVNRIVMLGSDATAREELLATEGTEKTRQRAPERPAPAVASDAGAAGEPGVPPAGPGPQCGSRKSPGKRLTEPSVN